MLTWSASAMHTRKPFASWSDPCGAPMQWRRNDLLSTLPLLAFCSDPWNRVLWSARPSASTISGVPMPPWANSPRYALCWRTPESVRMLELARRRCCRHRRCLQYLACTVEIREAQEQARVAQISAAVSQPPTQAVRRVAVAFAPFTAQPRSQHILRSWSTTTLRRTPRGPSSMRAFPCQPRPCHLLGFKYVCKAPIRVTQLARKPVC